VEGGAIDIPTRLEAVRSRLMLMVDGQPALLVSPDADVIITGFQGGYRYRERANGGYDDTPEKNWYSHSADSLQYLCTRLGNVTNRGALNPNEDQYNDAGEEFQSVRIHR